MTYNINNDATTTMMLFFDVSSSVGELECFWAITTGAALWSLLLYVSMTVLSTTTSTKGKKCNKSSNYHAATRLVSLVHAVLVTLTAFVVTIQTKDSNTQLGAPTMAPHRAALFVSLSYFTYDTAAMLFFASEHSEMHFVLHHILSLIGVAFPIYSGVSGFELVVVLGLAEVSNPGMHLLWLIDHFNLFKNKNAKTARLVVEVVFFLIPFFLARVIIGPLVTVFVLASPDVSIVLKAIAGSVQTMFIIFAFFVFRDNVLKGLVTKETVSHKEKLL
eukprot:PhM_4_TR19094/c0_g1_i1/m.43877